MDPQVKDLQVAGTSDQQTAEEVAQNQQNVVEDTTQQQHLLEAQEQIQQDIQQDILQKRREIEQEIEQMRQAVTAEIAQKSKELDQKLAEQRAELERRHAEQVQIMHKQVDARAMAARIEAEFRAGKEQVEAGIVVPGPDISSTADAEALMKTAVPRTSLSPEELAIARGKAAAEVVRSDESVSTDEVLQISQKKEDLAEKDSFLDALKGLFKKGNDRESERTEIRAVLPESTKENCDKQVSLSDGVQYDGNRIVQQEATEPDIFDERCQQVVQSDMEAVIDENHLIGEETDKDNDVPDEAGNEIVAAQLAEVEKEAEENRRKQEEIRAEEERIEEDARKKQAEIAQREESLRQALTKAQELSRRIAEQKAEREAIKQGGTRGETVFAGAGSSAGGRDISDSVADTQNDFLSRWGNKRKQEERGAVAGDNSTGEIVSGTADTDTDVAGQTDTDESRIADDLMRRYGPVADLDEVQGELFSEKEEAKEGSTGIREKLSADGADNEEDSEDYDDEDDGEENEIRRFRNRGYRRKVVWGRLIAMIMAMLLIAITFFCGTVFIYRALSHESKVAVVYPMREIFTVIGQKTQGGKSQDKHAEKEQTELEMVLLNERINILVLGSDYGDSEALDDEPKRTDAMLLLSFDPKNNKASVLSIPRDTKVILPGHRDPQKINAAYAFGGVMMAKQTVANLLGVPITHYALADWKAFTEIVDLIGGVDIFVEHDMKYDDPYANLHINLKKGFQHLDGRQAGQYVRYRSDELGDIGRTQRQQKFLKAAAEQMFSVSNVAKIPALISTIRKYVETDMSFLTVLKAVNSVKLFGNDRIKTGTLYGEVSEDDQFSYWSTDDECIRRTLRELDIPSSKLR